MQLKMTYVYTRRYIPCYLRSNIEWEARIRMHMHKTWSHDPAYPPYLSGAEFSIVSANFMTPGSPPGGCKLTSFPTNSILELFTCRLTCCICIVTKILQFIDWMKNDQDKIHWRQKPSKYLGTTSQKNSIVKAWERPQGLNGKRWRRLDDILMEFDNGIFHSISVFCPTVYHSILVYMKQFC